MLPSFSSLIIGLLLFLGVLVLLFFVFRELMCWYWKINRVIELLESIDRRLSVQTRTPAASPIVTVPLVSGISGISGPAADQSTSVPVENVRYVCGEFSNDSLQAVIDYSITKSGRRFMTDLQGIIDELMRKYEAGPAYEGWNIDTIAKESENPDFSEEERGKLKIVLAEVMQRFNVSIRGR